MAVAGAYAGPMFNVLAGESGERLLRVRGGLAVRRVGGARAPRR
jgi:hypothetical protein